jgi:hypothetical protein
MLYCFIALLATCGWAVAAADRSDEDLRQANRLLNAELKLAKEKSIYFVFDVSGGAVRFRASGLTVVELPIIRWRLWGVPPETRPTILADKGSLFEPTRKKIQIPPPESAPEIKADTEFNALELDDMPVRYRLLLEDGVEIRVVPAVEGMFGRLLEGGRTIGWYLSKPLISNWKFIRGKPYTELVLALQPRDARLLYWSFTAGSHGLVNWPRR